MSNPISMAWPPNHTHSHNKPWNEVTWKAPTSRQPDLYKHQNNWLTVEDGETVIDAFFNFYKSDLEPLRSYGNLRRFLGKSGARSVHDIEVGDTSQCKIMVDDRCDPCIKLNISENTSIVLRPWDSEIYNQRPPRGENVEVYGADVQTIFQSFRKPRKHNSERRIVYIADLTPQIALALICHVSHLHLPNFRSFLSKHVEFQAYMNVSQTRGFVLEFHLPHFVLRPDSTKYSDHRGLRTARYFRPPNSGPQDRIYESQFSLIICGLDDFFWTAYFCADGYHTAMDTVDDYLKQGVDGPSGGQKRCDWPIWDPRFYFLAVLAIRMSQVTAEWTVLVQELEDYLDPHGEIDQASLPRFLEDDPNLERTKEYTWVLGILRRLRNLLAKLVTTWNAFEMNHSIYFDLYKSGVLYDNFRERFYHIQGRIAELQALHMILEQRIETMEKMASILVNASSLAESINATRQGDNIQLLTRITIIYLPLTLITAVFSMKQVPDNVAWWKYWVSLVVFTTFTIFAAFGLPLFPL